VSRDKHPIFVVSPRTAKKRILIVVIGIQQQVVRGWEIL
jgi:hypothetical protein